MEPNNIRFGGGVAYTVLSPIVVLAILIAGLIIFTAGRRAALSAFLSAAILIPIDQVLVLGSAHFPMLRMLALIGLLRSLWGKFHDREPFFSGGINAVDKAVIALGILTLVNGMLLWQVWAQLVFQLGNLLTAFGTYFLLRFVIRNSDDVKHAIQTLAGVAALISLFMAYEKVTGVNVLHSVLGGTRVDVLGSVVIRDGVFRAAGPFNHPILAGTFGGILLPLFAGLWWKARAERKYAALGVVACCVIALAASSSTALFGFMGGIVGLCSWPLRRRLRLVRWAIVIVLISLHLAMKAPVWHLISRIDLTGSSSSYHRFQLINQSIIHFGDWVFVGTKNYADWGWDMWDLCNQYVAIADQSGLIPLLFFLATIILSFKTLGKARRSTMERAHQLFIWALGATLLANVVAFVGVSYFDQTIVAWYALLAMIPAAVSVDKTQHRSAIREMRANALLQYRAAQESADVSFFAVGC